jgi:hypothetical protein
MIGYEHSQSMSGSARVEAAYFSREENDARAGFGHFSEHGGYARKYLFSSRTGSGRGILDPRSS